MARRSSPVGRPQPPQPSRDRWQSFCESCQRLSSVLGALRGPGAPLPRPFASILPVSCRRLAGILPERLWHVVHGPGAPLPGPFASILPASCPASCPVSCQSVFGMQCMGLMLPCLGLCQHLASVLPASCQWLASVLGTLHGPGAPLPGPFASIDK